MSGGARQAAKGRVVLPVQTLFQVVFSYGGYRRHCGGRHELTCLPRVAAIDSRQRAVHSIQTGDQVTIQRRSRAWWFPTPPSQTE